MQLARAEAPNAELGLELVQSDLDACQSRISSSSVSTSSIRIQYLVQRYLSAGFSVAVSTPGAKANVKAFLGPRVVLRVISPDFSKNSILVISAGSLFLPTRIVWPNSRLSDIFFNVIGVLLALL